MRVQASQRWSMILLMVLGLALGPGGCFSAQAAETNSGETIAPDPQGAHQAISETEASPTGMRILYAPADTDEPAFRAAIARLSGATVDYISAYSTTPSAAVMAGYDCVVTYPNLPYQNATLMGDNLAAAVDAGKTTVILGSWSVPTAGNTLAGAILTPAYSPVMTPTGTWNMGFVSWAGDGSPAFVEGVVGFEGYFRDELATQGTGVTISTYTDGEIAVASRFPDWRVSYLNGMTRHYWNHGDWPMLVANLCKTGSFDVLVYDESTNNHWAAGSMGVFAANYSVVGASQFNTFLTAPDRDWDLVLVECTDTPPVGGWDDLIAYVNAGGKVVMSFWDWDNDSGMGHPGLGAAFGFTSTTSIGLTTSHFYQPAAGSAGAYVHAGVEGLPSNAWTGGWSDDGDIFGLAPGAEAIGVVTGANNGPVVIRNPAGNAIAAFLLDSWGTDQAEELWRNLASRVMDRSYWDGAAVSAEWLFPDGGTVYEDHQFVVKPTTDLTDAEITGGSDFAINLHGPYVMWDFSDATVFSGTVFNGWQFIDLAGELPAIGSAWLANNNAAVTGLDPHGVEYAEDRVRLDFSGMVVGAPTSVRLEVFFGLWADGFETGDTLRWVSTVGGR